MYGCDEDFFSNTKEIDLSGYEKEVAVTARFVNDFRDTSFFENKNYKVFLSEAKSIADASSEFTIIEDANVTLKSSLNGEYLYSYSEKKGSYLPDEEFSVREGEEFILEVTKRDEIDIYATLIIPKSPIINELRIIPNQENKLTDIKYDKIEIDIIDPEGNNYYMIESSYRIKAQYQQDTFFTIADGYIKNYNSVSLETNSLFTDAIFDGKEYTIEVWSERFLEERGDFISIEHIAVDIWTLSEEEYKYRSSLTGNEIANDNPFVEPSLIYSNMSNNIGIFSFSNVTRMIHEF